MPLDGEYADEKTGWVAKQLATIDETGTTESVDIMGMPVVVYTMRGAKSGKLRRVPLMRVEKDGVYAIVASYGGAEKHPAWYHNVTANPQIEILDGTQRHDAVAREITGAEREEWWARAVEAYPPYAEYQTKTDRLIPVLLAEPTS
ncbi:nitroreductase family deazaflavin-dependent oxidoreductase [Luteipulveratus halotolerans]|uniref:Nitroreductase n=1 Tax=Luteipulveratus halotolerans TaxID=1631356 RepID=A0A0L6CH88_9MICO|nr:nitroreductase family deazaflavin-dependent oxidoreductase [Luteipulveratus halotolerans]KNX37172.1 nitroreductase [Luteipulveratus halotolerans]